MPVKTVPFLELLQTQKRLFQTELIACKNVQSLNQLKKRFLGRQSIVLKTFNTLSINAKKQFSQEFLN